MIKSTPLLDHYAGAYFALVFLVLLLAQWKCPLRRQHFSKLRRLLRNLLFSAPGFALARISLVPIPLLTASWATQHSFGLLNLLPVPHWLVVLLGDLRRRDDAFDCADDFCRRLIRFDFQSNLRTINETHGGFPRLANFRRAEVKISPLVKTFIA